jgi:hypothetical protein
MSRTNCQAILGLTYQAIPALPQPKNAKIPVLVVFRSLFFIGRSFLVQIIEASGIIYSRL